MAKPGDTIIKRFTTRNQNGQAANTDSLPIGTLIKNGIDQLDVVNIVNKGLGLYNASWLIPLNYVIGDEVEVQVSGSVNSISDNWVIWSATIGSETSDFINLFGISYSDIPTADEYFLTQRLNSDEWFDYDDIKKSSALVTATRYIDTLNFIWNKTDENQPNEWPRNNQSTPRDIILACYEIAFQLICGRDVEYDAENLDDTQQRFETYQVHTTQGPLQLFKIHSIPSVVAWNLLSPYLRDGQSVLLSRVD